VDSVDLVDRLVPSPLHTLVIEAPSGELVLVDTERTPKQGDTVLIDDAFQVYNQGRVSGVAYCSIKFL